MKNKFTINCNNIAKFTNTDSSVKLNQYLIWLREGRKIITVRNDIEYRLKPNRGNFSAYRIK